MKTKMKFLTYIFLALVMAFTSCDGEDGAIGPAGPAGTNGTNGTNGQDGNANVVSVLLENQTVSIGANDFSVPELTQDIFDNGFVYGYVTVGGNDFWETLPVVTGGSVILDIDRISVGSIRLTSTFNQGNLNFRFLLVQGNSSGSKSMLDIKNMTYKEAMDYFGLDY